MERDIELLPKNVNVDPAVGVIRRRKRERERREKGATCRPCDFRGTWNNTHVFSFPSFRFNGRGIKAINNTAKWWRFSCSPRTIYVCWRRRLTGKQLFHPGSYPFYLSLCLPISFSRSPSFLLARFAHATIDFFSTTVHVDFLNESSQLFAIRFLFVTNFLY